MVKNIVGWRRPLFLFLVLLELEDGQNLVWSSREVDIEQEGDRVRVPLIRSREEDSNRDGVLDSLWLRAEFPLEPAEKVEAAHALLLFDYQLSRYRRYSPVHNSSRQLKKKLPSYGKKGPESQTLPYETVQQNGAQIW